MGLRIAIVGLSLTAPDRRHAISASCRHGSRSPNQASRAQPASTMRTRKPPRYQTPLTISEQCGSYVKNSSLNRAAQKRRDLWLSRGHSPPLLDRFQAFGHIIHLGEGAHDAPTFSSGHDVDAVRSSLVSVSSCGRPKRCAGADVGLSDRWSRSGTCACRDRRARLMLSALELVRQIEAGSRNWCVHRTRL
jgi:hypothetical protein